jgi:hypothetical protein
MGSIFGCSEDSARPVEGKAQDVLTVSPDGTTSSLRTFQTIEVGLAEDRMQCVTTPRWGLGR